MTRTWVAHGLSLALGAALTSVALWMFLGEPNPEKTPATTTTGAKTDSIPEHHSNRLTNSTAAISIESADPERARRLVEEALIEIRKSDARERMAHMQILLGQLRRAEDGGVEAMAAFLATGEDFTLGAEYSPDSFLVGFGGARGTVRKSMLYALSSSEAPGAREAWRTGILKFMQTTTSIQDLDDMVRLHERLEPDSHRAEIIAAMQRVLALPDHGANGDQTADINFKTLALISHFGATGPLPTIEAQVLKRPDLHARDFIGEIPTTPRAGFPQNLSAVGRRRPSSRAITPPREDS